MCEIIQIIYLCEKNKLRRASNSELLLGAETHLYIFEYFL